VLLVAVLVDATGSGLWAPFALLYFHLVAGLSLSAIGAALSIAAVFTIPMAFVAGALVDRFGARRIVLAAQLIQGLGFLVYPHVHDVWGMIPATAVTAVGNRLFWSSYFTLIAEIARPDERDRWYGLVGSARNVGYALGGLSAGLLVGVAATDGYRVLVLVNAASFLVAAALVGWSGRSLRWSRRSDDSPSPQPAPAGGQRSSSSYAMLIRDRPFLVLIAANTLFAVCSIMLGVGVPVYAVLTLRIPAWAIGLLFASNTVLLGLTQTFVVRGLEPHRRTRALVLAGALWCVWSVLLGLALGVPRSVLPFYVLAVTVIYTLAELIHAPTSNALAAAAAPDEQRGRYLAVFQLSWTTATLVSPILFTSLFTLEPAIPWLIVGLFACVASVAMVWLEARLPRQAVRSSAVTALH